MSLSLRIQSATWTELKNGLFQEITDVLSAIHSRMTMSEEFSRALPYHLSTKACSTSIITTATDVSQTTSAPQSTTSSSTGISPPTITNPTTNTHPSINSPPPLNHTRPTQVSRSNIWVSEANVSKLQFPEPSAHQNTQSFLRQVAAGEIDFWNANIQQEVTREDVELLQVPVNYGVYLCFVLEGTEIHHKILHRFARVALYYLSLQGHTAESLAQTLQGIVLFRGRETLRKQIEGYICAGSKYAHIAEQLGGLAALFFLPHDKGNSFWERRIPKSGPIHDKAIQNLRVAGIPEVSDSFHQLARSLLRRDAIHVAPAHIFEGRKRYRDESYQHESSKVPRLLSGSLCEQQRCPEDDASRDAEGQLEHIIVPAAIPSTNQGLQTSVLYNKASVARLDSLENILGQHLLRYMETSRTRCFENSRRGMGHTRLTSAVNLYIAVDKDCKLEIFLGKSIGEDIAQKLGERASLEYLKTLLGDHLFESMMTSTHRTEEEKRGLSTSTSAVTVSLPVDDDSSEDYILGVMLGCDAGVNIWYSAF